MLRRYLQKIASGPKVPRARRSETAGQIVDDLRTDRIFSSLSRTREELKRVLSNCDEVVFREMHIGRGQGTSALLLWLEGMTDKRVLNEDILHRLTFDTRLLEPNRRQSPEQIFELLQHTTLSVSQIDVTDSMSQVIMSVFSGEAALLVDGVDQAIILDTQAWEQRGVTEPATEAVVRGPREGFVENIAVNINMLRRKIHGPHLKTEALSLGRKTNTKVAVAYVEDVVNPKLVAEVKRRLARIDVDAVLESGYIEGFIEDAPLSPFFTVANTERPDVTAAKILEGRVAIFTDGSPFVLTVPTLFAEAFNVAEDSYTNAIYATFLRLIRYVSFFATLFLPGIYVAVQTFHQEILPTQLAIAMAADREAVPFPPPLEALLMLVIFDTLREAGVRMPRPIGQAVAIVGTLVLGTAAVDSRLVSPAMVMVVSLTGITSFVLPPQLGPTTVLKYPILFLTSTLGLYGGVLSLVGLLIHLNSLRSFGTPFLSPFGPTDWASWKGVLVRTPHWMLEERPEALFPVDRRRQKDHLKPDVSRPGPSRSGEEEN